MSKGKFVVTTRSKHDLPIAPNLLERNFTPEAPNRVWFRRRPAPGLIFHSDRGSQYCSQAFQDALKGYEMKSSMSRKGDCWDTQSNIAPSAAFGLTRAGIGVVPLR